MSMNARLRSYFSGTVATVWDATFEALMSPDKPDLYDCLARIKKEGDWPDVLRFGIEGLQTFRDYYGDRRNSLPSGSAVQLEKMDEEWTTELLEHLHELKFGMPSRPLSPPGFWSE